MISSLLGSALEPALESVVRSLLVAGVVWAGLRVFRIRSVLAQKTVWGLVLAAAVLMPFLLPLAARWRVLPIGATVVLPAPPLRLLVAEDPSPQAPSPARAESFDGAMNAAVLPDSTRLIISAPSEPEDGVGNRISDETRLTEPEVRTSPDTKTVTSMAPANTKPVPAPHRPISIPELAWLLYLSVTAGLLLRMVYGLASAIRLWHGAEPVTMDALRGSGGLHLRASRAVASPVTIGSGVVLPADYADWDAEKLRIVLAHERSHIRQGDFYLQLLAGLYTMAFWFSPLGWWLKSRLSDLAEAISDRAGLCEAASRSAYAQILLEFAAKPRLTRLGVAMARSGSLSRRIDRVLNDSVYQQAFAASRTRVAAAGLLVPIALFASTSLVRVQAAEQVKQAAAPAAAPMGPIHVAVPKIDVVVPKILPVPPIGPIHVVVPKIDVVVPKIAPVPQLHMVAKLGPLNLIGPGVYAGLGPNANAAGNQASAFGFSSDGDSYVLVKRDGESAQISGSWLDGHRESIEKARKLAHGDFLWFTHKGKSYFIDDSAIVSSIEASMDAEHEQQEKLGKEQEALGRRQEALAKMEVDLSRRQMQASVSTPDMGKEIAQVEAALAELKANQGKSMSNEEWAKIESELGELQARLGAMRGEMGAKMSAFGDKQGALGGQQRGLGEQQGWLGERQALLAMEMQKKVQSIIDQSLQNGKAHPEQ